MTLTTFLMHTFYIAAPTLVGFYLGYRFAKRSSANSLNKEYKRIED